MNLLTMEHITKSYTDRVLLDDAAFSIQNNEKIGVIGINGMGKSTLLKLLAGIEKPNKGEVIMGGNIKVGFLPQTPQFEDGTTLIEAALSNDAHYKDDMAKVSEAKSMLNKLGLGEFEQKTECLSGGQRKKVALVSVLIKPVDILILDEPTNHLDNEMSGWLEEYLIKYKGAIVMVTHDRYFLDRVSTRIVEVDKGKIYSYPGNYSEYLRLKEARIESEFATERKRQSILRTELEWLSRGAKARSTKQKAHIQRIEDMQLISSPVLDSKVEMNSVSSRMGKKTIEVNNVSKKYGDKVLFNDFSYNFLRQDRIGIIGPNGCGKSTLMKVILGIVQQDSGTIEMGQTIKIGYFSQENEYMDDETKVIDYVKEVGEFIQTKDGTVSAAKMLEKFLFEGALQYAKIGKLSGGEKRRLYLLRVLMKAPNVLILDEPTNDLDIQTLTTLEDYLDSFDGIVITVSHDRYFLDRVVRRIFAFENDGHIRQYEGGYSDYLIAYDIRYPQGMDTNKKSNNEKKDSKKSEKPKQKKLKFSYNEMREYEKIDEEIAELESMIEEKEKEIISNASNYGKLNALTMEKNEIQKKLDEKMERWIYLNDLAERIKNS